LIVARQEFSGNARKLALNELLLERGVPEQFREIATGGHSWFIAG